MRRLAATAALALGACTHLPQDIKVEADGRTIEVKKGCVCVSPEPPGEKADDAPGDEDDQG